MTFNEQLVIDHFLKTDIEDLWKRLGDRNLANLNDEYQKIYDDMMAKVNERKKLKLYDGRLLHNKYNNTTTYF